MNLNDRERRLIYILRKLRFARVVVTVRNGCLTVCHVEQQVRLDAAEQMVDIAPKDGILKPVE